MSETEREELPALAIRTLISGCHILHYHQILDAYGHLSVRHPTRPDVFLLPKNAAPANVKSPDDIVQYYVSDASAVDAASPSGYVERFIHSEIYKKYPNVHSIVHSHASAVLPYTITDIPMRACCHMSGFLGNSVPLFDIADHYGESDIHDLLVRNQGLGEALSDSISKDIQGALHPVVLMRGHGFTAVGNSIEESVFRSIYTAENARNQTVALTLTNSMGLDNSGSRRGIQYLRDSEISPTTEMGQWSCMRPWNLWVREVEAAALYVNLA